jgi:hypothetical protein
MLPEEAAAAVVETLWRLASRKEVVLLMCSQGGLLFALSKQSQLQALRMVSLIMLLGEELSLHGLPRGDRSSRSMAPQLKSLRDFMNMRSLVQPRA